MEQDGHRRPAVTITDNESTMRSAEVDGPCQWALWVRTQPALYVIEDAHGLIVSESDAGRLFAVIQAPSMVWLNLEPEYEGR